jgi:hypothetical protein
MHDWHGFAIWIGVLFVVLPAVVGGGFGYLFYRCKFRAAGACLKGVIEGAVIGAAAGGIFLVISLGY